MPGLAVTDAEGRAWLKQNGARDDVVTRASGLQYRVLQSGDGPYPTPNSVLDLHFRGCFTDGTEFETTYGGEPIQLKPVEAIPGWKEALMLMREGDKFAVAVPSELSYGAFSFGTHVNDRLEAYEKHGDRLPPGKVLVFELEICKVQPLRSLNWTRIPLAVLTLVFFVQLARGKNLVVHDRSGGLLSSGPTV